MTIYRDDTFFFFRDVKDENGNFEDPDSHLIQVFKPDGEKQGDDMTAPVKRDSETGKFKQAWTAPSDAVYGKGWRCDWTVTKGSAKKKEITWFEITEIKPPDV